MNANPPPSKLPRAKAAETPSEPREVRIVGGVSLEPGDVKDTPDLAFWSRLRTSSELLSFDRYQAFIDATFCHLGSRTERSDRASSSPARLPFPDIQSYRALKGATEVFMEFACGVAEELDEWGHAYARDSKRLGLAVDGQKGEDVLKAYWASYLEPLPDTDDVDESVIPYLVAVRANLRSSGFRPKHERSSDDVELCEFLIAEKALHPCHIELIWSYWHEEGLLVRVMEAISRRFQNKGLPSGRNPLAELEITPLRPLNNVLWGYIQDEQHRLTAERRFYEYDHHYGLRPSGGRALGFRPADSRSRFLDAFHMLLQKSAAFFKEDDDTTVLADAFPVLNALREVHILLAEGAHNQFGDLPWTARLEMLMEQWILARPEFDEFLPSRKSVVFPEVWMHRVEAMKRMHGWEQPSVRHFNNLARYGELLLLSVRYGNWSVVDDVDSAQNWVRFWRQEIQWYIHSYHAVTRVDLASGMVDVRSAGTSIDRAAQPAALIQARAAGPALGPVPSQRRLRSGAIRR